MQTELDDRRSIIVHNADVQYICTEAGTGTLVPSPHRMSYLVNVSLSQKYLQHCLAKPLV